ncbi:hypothetical protein M422DRAFT_271993 [Sphaerobolus stellatus SS14]|uniref:Uncharacterized protein n=1 Tax=Sphaerobolus stellatus (strain SS14) TaxID=990650 RepID=A0A0C9UNQ7_SPHS4|nr:hypothetical protein M422DRAFT_271993 [Sphaerobolus stellatus SS14]
MDNEDHPGDIFILWDIWMSIQMGERVDEKAWLDLKWRRFLAEGSILARLSKKSCITVRGDQEGNTVIDIREEEWSLPSSVSSVKDWANGMDDQSFVRGSVIEKFQYIFALAMAKRWGKLHADETWCSSAIIGVEDSLANLIRSADTDRLRKSKRLLKSQRFLPRPKPKPVEAKVAIEVIKTTNGYTSDNAMDVDIPPQTLVITPSPTKHGNVESRQTQVNPTEDDQTISSLNSFEQPVILDSQSSDGELEEAIVVDSPRKKRPSSEESVDTPPIKKQKSDDAPALAEEIVGNNPNSNSPLILEPQGPKKRGRKAKQNVGGDSLSTGKRAPEVRPLRSMTTRARTKQPAKALERPVEGSVQPSETLMQSAETSTGQRLSVDSCITVRGDQEGHTVITTYEREWSKSVSVVLVKNWTDEMDEGSFSRGSTIETFQFIYAVAMVNWWGDSEAQQWCKGSAGKLEDWLASLIRTAAPNLLRKYTRVLKYAQSTSHSSMLVVYITIQGAWGGEAYTPDTRGY